MDGGRRRPGRVPRLAEPRRGAAPARAHRIGGRAVTRDAGAAQPVGQRRDEHAPWSSTRWTRASAAGQQTMWDGSCSGWGATRRCCASRTCPRLPPAASAHYRVSKDVRDGRTVTAVQRLAESDRAEELARMMAGGTVTPSVLASARELLVAAAGPRPPSTGRKRTPGKRRKRKSKGERSKVSRKYLIETFGCQMNYHDSEQMSGLLESAGYERTAEDRDADVIVINTCSVQGAGRRQAVYAARRTPCSWAARPATNPSWQWRGAWRSRRARRF